jgi:hypothetical protein
MTIEAQQLQTWIGTEVLDRDGAKLGKLEDVYFRDSEPLAVGIRSGLAGRKHHVAALRGASVSRSGLHLDTAADELVAADADGLGISQLAALAARDDRLQAVGPDDLEGWNAREERLKAQAEAEASAVKLEDEARRHGAEEDAASAEARAAEQDAAAARHAREDAETQAQRAREAAAPTD